jgi:hypothetical protein
VLTLAFVVELAAAPAPIVLAVVRVTGIAEMVAVSVSKVCKESPAARKGVLVRHLTCVGTRGEALQRIYYPPYVKPGNGTSLWRNLGELLPRTPYRRTSQNSPFETV